MENIPDNSDNTSANLNSASEDCFRLPDVETNKLPTKNGLGSAKANPDEVTTLERRVLAHERILQALICDLASDDPRILDLLRARFGEGWNLGSYENDYITTDQYGETFIRTIEKALKNSK